MKITKKWMLAAILVCGASLFTTSCTTAENDNPTVKEIDYLVLVNKTHQLPAYWENALKTVTTTNTVGEQVEAEYKAYAAYLKLKEAIAEEGVDIELDSGRRSVAEQQDIWDRFMIKYGEEYTVKTVAIDDVALAKDITARGITLEEYLEEK